MKRSRNRTKKKMTRWLVGDVDTEMLHLVGRVLRSARGGSVHFYLSSDGGDETAGLGICDLITLHRGQVTITVVGSAESMAAVILQSADLREITENSHIMLHQGETTAEGHKKNIKAFLKIADKQDDICDEMVLRRIRKKYPKYTWGKFREESNFDMYFTSEQALMWNLVDRIVK